MGTLPAYPFDMMMNHRAALTALLLFLGAGITAGCATAPRSETAYEAQAQCDPAAESQLQPVLDGSAVESVTPLYVKPGSEGAEPGPQLLGASIRVRPLWGESREWLTRALACHKVRTPSGAPTSAQADPFALPDESIDVASAADGYRITVRGGTPDAGHELLRRALALAAQPHFAPPAQPAPAAPEPAIPQ
jgi:hypothetical protein